MRAVRVSVDSFTKVEKFALRRFAGNSSITYSGGQAIQGQGGYYGSGGTRAQVGESKTERIAGMQAMPADVQRIKTVMKELEKLQHTSGSSIKSCDPVETLMSDPEIADCLSRLQVKGEPVWGLSKKERDLIRSAKETVRNL